METLKNKYKRGFSLIELLLTISIILTLSISIFILGNKLYSDRKSEQEIENIKTVTAGISQLYASKRSYDGISISILINANILPPEMIRKNNKRTAYNAFKGVFSVTASVNNNINNGLGSNYVIQDSSIPPNNCIKIVSALKNNFYKITVGETMIVNNYKEKGDSFQQNTNYSIENLTKACNNGTSNNNNNLIQFYGN